MYDIKQVYVIINIYFLFSVAGPSHQISIPDDEQLVSPDTESVQVHRTGPRKSVSIVLPAEENG